MPRIPSHSLETAPEAGWSDGQLAEAFAYIGLILYIDSWVRKIRSCSSPVLMQEPAEQIASVHLT